MKEGEFFAGGGGGEWGELANELAQRSLCLFFVPSRVVSADKPVDSAPSGAAVDIGVVRYTAKEILPANVQAKPEEGEVAQKLIPTLSDAEIEEVNLVNYTVNGLNPGVSVVC